VRYQSASKLAFKITGPSRIGFLSSLFPDAYFLHITRKPVPTIASFLKVPFWKTRGINQLWWHFDLSLEEQAAVLEHNNDPVWMTAFQISKIIETTQYELEKVRPNYLRISYEDFIKDPKESISEVFSFIGISNHNRCFDYLKDNPILERSVSDDKYFDKDNLKKIYSFFPECK
jgi:hypothetical protein